MKVSPMQPHMEAVRVVPGHAVIAHMAARCGVAVLVLVLVLVVLALMFVAEKGEQWLRVVDRDVAVDAADDCSANAGSFSQLPVSLKRR
jgi:uncharacterized membrane protein